MTSRKGSKAKASYHHGDLPRRLVEAAVAAIEAEGVDRLSLRDLARAIGVSHAAPYRHFVDKRALLAAIALEGFTLLTSDMRTAFDRSESNALKELEDLAWAYVKFAIDHPVHILLMFGPEFAVKTEYPSLHMASAELLALVQVAIERSQNGKNSSNGDMLAQTAAAWAMVHGLAVLLSNHRLKDQGFDAFSNEQLTRLSVRTLFEGLGSRYHHRDSSIQDLRPS